LGYEFTTYGSQVLAFTEEDPYNRIDPMAKVFPKVTKCTFNKYGPSGNIVPYDGLCVLPLNIVNEKIYVFLWFWFIIVAILSAIAIVARALIIFLPKVRVKVLQNRARLTNNDHLERVVDHCKLGDWLVLDLLCKNIDPLNFRDLVNDYYIAMFDSKNPNA